MTQICFHNAYRRGKVIRKLPNDHRRVLYMDNCSGQNCTLELKTVAERIKTELEYLTPIEMLLIQPCDSFVIKKVKQAWSTRWVDYKMKHIAGGKGKDSSGKVANPGKICFSNFRRDV